MLSSLQGRVLMKRVFSLADQENMYGTQSYLCICSHFRSDQNALTSASIMSR